MNFILLYVLINYLIGLGLSCFDTDSKTICGCSKESIGKRMYCGRTKDYHDIFLQSNLPKDVVSIQLTNNEITSIPANFFPSEKSKSFLNILELLLEKNKIEFVETGAFQYFEALKVLNLSHNQIGRLHQGMFKGLNNLKRLSLEYNTFPIIAGDTFIRLTSLMKLNVESDHLTCNCLMKDFLNWFRQRQLTMTSKIRLSGSCKFPVQTRGKNLRSIKLNLLNCDQLTTLPLFEIEPESDQLVFTGDNTRLSCEGTDLNQSQVLWSFNDDFVDSVSNESFVETTYLHSNRTTIESYVDLTVSPQWSGEWMCTVTSNYSRHTGQVRLVVLEEHTGYCDGQLVENDFGDFKWPEVVKGARISLNCGVGAEWEGIPRPQAVRTCIGAQMWSEGNYTDCQYVDPVARTLAKVIDEDFNHSPFSLCNTTAVGLMRWEISAVIGFKLLSEFMSKCVKHLNESGVVGSALVQLSSRAMDSSSELIMTSQRSNNVCDVIDDVIGAVLRSNLDRNISYYNQNTSNMAVYAYNTEKSRGLKCNVSVNKSETAVHCVAEKSSPRKPVRPGIYISDASPDRPLKIAVIIYRNGRLFQASNHTPVLGLTEYQKLPIKTTSPFPANGSAEAPNDSADEELQRPLVLVSNVYSVLPFNNSKLNMSTSITLIFRSDERVSFHQKRHFLVMWDATKWRHVETECQPLGGTHSLRNLSVVKCKWFGTYAIAKNLDEESPNLSPPTPTFLMHPTVYVGAAVLSLCLCAVVITYLIFPNLLISRESRHSLVNLCVHLFLALLAYILGVGRADREILCYASGVTIHYSSLSVLAWLLLTARIMGKEMVASQQPPPAEPKPKRPMLRFYLIACGIPVMICGITAAANIHNYHKEGSTSCWLSWDTSLYAFFVPAALTAVSCVLILLRILATLNCNQKDTDPHREASTERSHLNESTPLHLSSSSKHPSIASIHKQDFNEQNFGVRLRGAVCTLILSIVSWLFAAFAVAAADLQDSTNDALQSEMMDSWILSEEEADSSVDLPLVFSCLFAVSSSSMGVFLIYQHVISRSDTSLHWRSLFRCKTRRSPSPHSDGIELIANIKSRHPKNTTTATASVTEELTLETVAPVTAGEETSLTVPPSSTKEGGRGDNVPVNGPFIVNSVSNKYPSFTQAAGSSISHQHGNAPDQQRRTRAAVKLTNLQIYQQQQEPSLTEHSFDDSQVNMHTVPVILQQHQVKPDNSEMYQRHQKIRKNLEAKRSRKQKLTVLREFAHDPLTSNDEEERGRKDQGGNEGPSSWSFNDIDSYKIDEKMLENLAAINEYKKADEMEKLNNIDIQERPLRPLLISSPLKKKEKLNSRPRPHRKRPNRNPNLASTYKAKKPESSNEFESDDDPLLSVAPHTNGAIRANPSSHSVEDASPRGRGEDRHLLAENHKSHSYLTASAILTNPFHIPARNSAISAPTTHSPPPRAPEVFEETLDEVNPLQLQDIETQYERLGNETSI